MMTDDGVSNKRELTKWKRTDMSESSGPQSSVVVIGGGYGGITAAKALDEVADVTLVEPREAFFHNVAALRGLVKPEWLPGIFIPYGGLLERGRVIQDRAVVVDGSTVDLASGEQIRADYVVIATGSRYPYPAKSGDVRTEDAHRRYRSTHDQLDRASSVVLVGAGPVGIELAGEIHDVWPDTAITLVDAVDDLLGGRFNQALRDELRRQLLEIGVTLVLGSPLKDEPPTDPGELGPFEVTTTAGDEIAGDIWFRCYGVDPVSDFLAGDLLAARGSDGFIAVNGHLQVAGSDHVFAIGDVADADAKMAGFARNQAEVVVANVKTLMAHGTELETYQSMGEVIVVPIGPEGGSGQLPGQDEVAAPEFVAQVKGRDLMVDAFTELMGASTPE
jgi:NADH dehydrogenase FAD-containing subunit